MLARGKKTGLYVALITGISTLLFVSQAWHSVPGYNVESGFGPVQKAYLNQQSGLMVEVLGKVVRILSDDKDDLQHQKFIIRLQNGQNLLVTQNIVAAEKAPVSINHEVTVRGEYSWTEPGGLIQWTRYDSSAQRRHGWIEHQGQKYD
jgi:hypothetical protein